MAKNTLADTLNAAMDKHELGAKEIAKHLGVSVASIYQWQKGRDPRDSTLHKVMRRLQKLEETPPAQADLLEADEPAAVLEPNKPVNLSMDDGNGLHLQVKISHKTARQVLEVLFK